MRDAVNRFLDHLPRTSFGGASHEVPAFRTCGVVGYYVGLVATLGGGLLAGRSLRVLAVLAVVCALSFFVYVYVRRWLTGRETLVLLDQVWFAELCVGAALAGMGQPLLPYLDVVSVGIAFFLSGGRVGCTLVGCCHGRPSAVGIVYPAAHAEAGFAPHLVGVRLFPVQAIEAAGLALIGLTGLVALPFAPAGRVFVWFLAGYAVLRFGTEGLRGDARPHFLGLSKPRWMALAELGLALWIGSDGNATPVALGQWALLAAALAAGLAARHRFDPRPRLLAAGHVAEVREAVTTLAAALDDARLAPASAPPPPSMRATSAGVLVGLSREAGGLEHELHASISLPGGLRDVELLCELAGRAWPTLRPSSGQLTGHGVLHFRIPEPDPPLPGARVSRAGAELYGAVVRRLQRPASVGPEERSDRQRYFRGARVRAPWVEAEP